MFIYPDLGWNSINFSPAFLCLSAYLKAKLNVDVKLLHLNEKYGIPYEPEKICEMVEKFSPDLIGFTCTSYAYHYVNELSGILKERGTRTPIILGGSHATIVSEDLITSNVDAFCIGEGENALVDICRRIIGGGDITKTPGFWFKNAPEPNPYAEPLADLDELPFRDYALMDTRSILEARGGGWMNVGFSRGCPYSCTFCVNQQLRKLHRKATDKPFFRTQSVDRVIAELEDLVKNYEGIVHIFNFDDDLLILKKDWFLRFAAEYAERIYKPYGIRYVINARANLLDDARIEALSVSGCYEVQIGFETGCEDLRNGILQKQITNSQLEFVFRRCREKKVRTLAYTMLGIPLETPDTIKTTVRVLAKLKPTLIRMTIFDPFYGTPLYDYCVDNNLFKTNGVELSNHFTMSRLKFDGLTDADIADTELLFPWLLNAEIGLTDYAPLAERYKNSEDRPAVLAADAEISRKHMERHIPHFRYFDGNNFYYNYWDGESD